MPAYVIPVDMRGNSSDRLCGQLFNLLGYVADTKPRIDQQGAFTALQQVAMGLLPMPIFADNMCI